MSKKVVLENGARLGYMARGFIYLLLASFTLMAAIDATTPKGTKGALSSLLDEQFGSILLIAFAVGLIFYSIWRAIQAITDLDGHGTSVKGIAIRLGLFTSFLFHLSLSFWAIQVSTKFLSKPTSGSGETWSQILMSYSWGFIVMYAIAISILATAFAHIWKGYNSGFKKRFNKLPAKWLSQVCQFGLISKGLAYTCLAFLFFLTARDRSDSKPGGLEQSLEFIQNQAYGSWLLMFMGLGLMSFAVYSFLEARYREVFNN